MISNQLQKSLEVIAAFFFLNLLWVIFCLPIFTIFPSTAAMFNVVRQWKETGIDYNIGKSFVAAFKTNFKQTFLIGIIWLLTGVVLFWDYYFIVNFSFSGKNILIGILVLITFIYMGMSIFLLPIAVNFQLSMKHIFKNAFLFTMGKIGTTFLCLLLLGSVLVICYFVPFFLWIVGSVLAFFIYSVISNLNHELWT